MHSLRDVDCRKLLLKKKPFLGPFFFCTFLPFVPFYLFVPFSVLPRNRQLQSRELQARRGSLLRDRSRRGRCGSSLSIHVRKARPSQQRIYRTRTCPARSFLPLRMDERKKRCFLGTLFRRQSIDRVPSLLFFFRRNLYAVRSGTHSGCFSFFSYRRVIKPILPPTHFNLPVRILCVGRIIKK
jgi:hypothetical protein